ncbi:unnamed protein product [Protopolystoma xenopodis]|uniref:Uncharacterized protein n=1 Tax=Protopolystoma xenopodis TaxID=117903 RepID=A0A3S5APK9_9PLAT|nr:unnamed protein product [Protopolystoma xenopodis]
MRFNSMLREKPYQPLTWWSREAEMHPFSSAGPHTGVAWLSSARVVRCWVKSRNERNPHSYLPAGEDDVKSSWPLRVGLHACYNGIHRGKQDGDVEQIPKRYLSSDCSLQLESMKLESLVIADQHAAVNTFSGLVHTARHAMGVGFT